MAYLHSLFVVVSCLVRCLATMAFSVAFGETVTRASEIDNYYTICFGATDSVLRPSLVSSNVSRACHGILVYKAFFPSGFGPFSAASWPSGPTSFNLHFAVRWSAPPDVDPGLRHPSSCPCPCGVVCSDLLDFFRMQRGGIHNGNCCGLAMTLVLALFVRSFQKARKGWCL